MTDTKVSVIIPTYNRCYSVQRLLNALTEQSFPSNNYEVIVSIDGSEDGTKKMVNEFRANYKLRSVWHTNSGRASACNRGILEAVGEVLILLDDDMEPSHHFVEAHYSSHPENSRLGIIGAAPIHFNEYSSSCIRYIGSKFNSHLKKISTPNYDFTLRDFYSGNFSIRREVLLEVGIFNETFKVYGNEDLELAWRLLRSGIKLKYCTKALAIQYYEKDFAGLARDTIAKGSTAVLLASMYPDTYNYLKLSTYKHVSWKWRSLRATLIKIAIIFPKINALIILFSNLIEKLTPNYITTYYALALDYFFWLGALSALKRDDILFINKLFHIS